MLFHRGPRFLRDPARLRLTEMFNCLDQTDLADFNELLAHAGRSIEIIEIKGWGIAGTPGRVLENGDYQEPKPDVYWRIVDYWRTPDSPYIPRNDRLKQPEQPDEPPGDNRQPATNLAATPPGTITIELPARPAKKKKNRKAGTKNAGRPETTG